MEGFDGISYKDRLRELGLMTLETIGELGQI